jgi:hypothetical protein
MDDLSTLCEEMRSGGLDISIDDQTHDINLVLVNSKNSDELRIMCKQVHVYKIVRDPIPDEPPYFVGEVLIQTGKLNDLFASNWHFQEGSLPESGWMIDITGAANIQIVCLELTTMVIRSTVAT